MKKNILENRKEAVEGYEKKKSSERNWKFGSSEEVAGNKRKMSADKSRKKKKDSVKKKVWEGNETGKPAFKSKAANKAVVNKGEEVKKAAESKQLPCPYFKKCGGCNYLDLSYDKQLKIKQRMVEKLVGKYCRVQPIKGMKQPYHYRNKVHAAFDRDSRGNILSGIYKEGTHRVVSIDSCLLEDEKADEIILTIRGMLKSFKIKTYDEDTGYGLLRHVLIRRGFATGQIMVVLVTGSPIFPSRNNFVKALLKVHPEITTIVQNINEKKTSMVLGEREQVMYGRGYIEDVLCGITFRISSRSFYQVNPVQTEYLYKKAVELAGLTGKETVIDAYCGIGTIGMTAAAYAAKVIGVELNKDAVRDAVLNAKNNHVENIDFYCNDAGKFMEQYAAREAAADAERRADAERAAAGNSRENKRQTGKKNASSSVDVVFMDPPRSGSSEKFMDSLALLKPKKIVYISCNPETLARDLEYLGKKGYRALECYPVDMFCWTEHVETVVLLSKGMVDNRKVKVDFSLEDMDLSEFKGKATYEQIKVYVLEQTGLKVSNLYIAQIKKKCGLDVGENFNLPKSENAKQPKCTPEKEEAIMQAFKHFGII